MYIRDLPGWWRSDEKGRKFDLGGNIERDLFCWKDFSITLHSAWVCVQANKL
jgi:hypothetical protein